MFPTLATFRFVFPTLGPGGTPPPPPPYWDICDQWEQGCSCNESLYNLYFRPCGVDLLIFSRILMHFVSKKWELLICYAFGSLRRFHTERLLSRWRLEALRAFPTLATFSDRFPRWDPEGPPTPSIILGSPIYKPEGGSEIFHALWQFHLLSNIACCTSFEPP